MRCSPVQLYTRPQSSASPTWSAVGTPAGVAFERLVALGSWLAGYYVPGQGQGRVQLWTGSAWRPLPAFQAGGVDSSYQVMDVAAAGNDLYVLYRGGGEQKRGAGGAYRMIQWRRTPQTDGGWRLVPTPVSFSTPGVPISIDATATRTAVLTDQGVVLIGGPGFTNPTQRMTSSAIPLRLVRLVPDGMDFYVVSAEPAPHIYRPDGRGGAVPVELGTPVSAILDLTAAPGGQLLVAATTSDGVRLIVPSVQAGLTNTYSETFNHDLRTVVQGNQLIVQGARCDPV